MAVTVRTAEPTVEEFSVALAKAANEHGSPFHLQVQCTAQKETRSFNLFPGGVTLWEARSQLKLSEATRVALLNTLIEQGFSQFKASYGGGQRPDKKATGRASCRVWVKIGELRKASIQKAAGKQSAELMHLAGTLLDQVEPFAENGVTPSDLQDGLEKLSSGELAIESLSLRFIEIPPRDYIRQGSITRLRGGKISRQAYAPGRAPSEQAREPMAVNKYQELLRALLAAKLDSLPNNLWSGHRLEFEIQILTQKKIVLGGPAKEVDSDVQESTQQRFNTLLPVLRELGQ